MFKDFFKVSVILALCTTAFVLTSCDKDDDSKTEVCPYNSLEGQYVGHEQILGEWNGTQVLDAPIENAQFLILADEKKNTLSVVVPEIKDLVIEQKNFTINMPSFTIEGLETYYSEDSWMSIVFGCDYEIAEVECDLGRGTGKYPCSGHAAIRVKDFNPQSGVELEYTFKLGSMPFSLKADVFGVKKENK
ncbi:MAG: hypothetical protein KBT20_07740 [Bacteroidales bacterium]|nr:hypothetical protein [Candidatus Liminaster caballi]